MSSFLQNLDWSVLTNVLLRAIPALICITVHELCHGLTALALGDETAKRMGRLTLNPIKHIDWMGLVMLLLAGFGWAKPVPVNMRAFSHPKRDMAITALAGPVSNFLLAVVFYFLYGAFFTALYGKTVGGLVLQLLRTTGYLSIALGLFNLLPIPPLDGSKVLFSLLPESAYAKLMVYERYGTLLLLLIVVLGLTRGPLNTAAGAVDGLYMNISMWAFHLIGG